MKTTQLALAAAVALLAVTYRPSFGNRAPSSARAKPSRPKPSPPPTHPTRT
jgi:hypothetical protein